VRERMMRDLGRVATPAIVVGKRVFWGFEENRLDIAELLGVDPRSDGDRSVGADTDPEPVAPSRRTRP